MVDLADCVEAHITAIAVVEQTKSIRISLRSALSTHFAMVVEGVHQVLVEEFRYRNIVDRVHIWNSANDLDAYHECLAALMAGKSEGLLPDAWRIAIEKEARSIQAGNKILVEIEPAYGA